MSKAKFFLPVCQLPIVHLALEDIVISVKLIFAV